MGATFRPYLLPMVHDEKPVKGRGAASQVRNRFLKQHYALEHWEAIDEPMEEARPTRYLIEHPKSIVNKVDSLDLPFVHSLNPYQGCEHGCAYCYARPTHEYWGYSAGLDFEQVIIVKRNAPELLEKTLRHPKWKAEPISISGATDPYQPIERKEELTRRLLRVASDFNQPVSLITKNSMVLRDLDILQELASRKLVAVAISLTTLNEDLRRVMEPRTSTGQNRLRTIAALHDSGVPVMAMIAPIIPALNETEVPALLKAAADAGALTASYTLLRTNGPVQAVFEQWLRHHFPDRAGRIMAQTKASHGGSMNDSMIGRRMRGEGAFAENIKRVFTLMRKRYFKEAAMPTLERGLFKLPPTGQLDLFG
ncbi:MAG: PA0069 family radical SAM protein [Flavobacteriales bacterium]|nr:PA0069 family radical SAM protein [Flavobacteriales bacterium]